MATRVTYLMRLWLHDRPGALSAVAARFGALKGDVVGLEIIERGGGVAVDELLVSFPIGLPEQHIIKELHAEEGVHVEQMRRFDESMFDPERDLLDAAAVIMAAETPADLATHLAERSCQAVTATWACVINRDGLILGSTNKCPAIEWLQCFISGSSPVRRDTSGLDTSEVMDTVWLELPAACAAVVVGSDYLIRSRERQRLAGLAVIADLRFGSLRGSPDSQILDNPTSSM